MPLPSAFPCCAVTSWTARLLTLLLGFGEALEAWTRKKSLDSLAQSLALDVDTVWVRREGREMHVAISELSEDDLVIVRTGSAIPVDGGAAAEGEASVNQASMTGEPLGVLALSRFVGIRRDRG